MIFYRNCKIFVIFCKYFIIFMKNYNCLYVVDVYYVSRKNLVVGYSKYFFVFLFGKNKSCMNIKKL